MLDPASQIPDRFPSVSSGGPTPSDLSGPRAASGDSAELSGVRFRALLEDLEQRAKAVALSAQTPQSAESLPAAVAEARGSLEDALRIQQSLLEACRQLGAQGGPGAVGAPGAGSRP